MKRRRSRVSGAQEVDINMTPMIDIVFQLLIFFVLTAKFIEFEGELRSYLPKNRGLNSPQTTVDLANVTVYLDWKGDPRYGTCVAITTNYQPESGGVEDRHQFSSLPRGSHPAWQKKGRIVEYEYPDFDEIENYIRYRRDSYTGVGYGLPVTINFTNKVPVQMVVNMVDICIRLGIKDFALNAQGVE